MQIIKTPLEGLLVIKPVEYTDDRGSFFESWSKQSYKEIGIDVEFVQDNQSISQKGVLRGLHFQSPPFAQGKLVRVIKGSVIDVAVDIRKNSSTYGAHYSIELSEKNKTIFWIPPGFAHGFVSLEDNTIFSYKCSAPYNKESEGSLIWNDKDLDIKWSIVTPKMSEKDKKAEAFKHFTSPF